MAKYHLYLEFWSKDKNKEKVLLVVEREFDKFCEVKGIIAEFKKILCGD